MSFARHIRRNVRVAFLPLIGLCAFFNARSFSQVLGIALGADDKQLSASPLPVRTVQSAQTRHTTSADAILSRNPFDHATGPLKEVPNLEATTTQDPNTTDPLCAPVCEGIKLIAVAVLDDPEFSFAAMTVPGEAKPMLRRRMQDIGGKKIVYIGRERVWFSTGRTFCQAELFRESAKPANASSTAPRSSSALEERGAGVGVRADILTSIKKTGATAWDIDRGTVDKIIENQVELLSHTRVVPEKEGDKTVGIRLFGLKPDSFLGVLGMENGDRLQTINGFDVANPERALEAYARIRFADKITVSVNRRGANVDLDYTIR
jgi:general secretion pathway protein C